MKFKFIKPNCKDVPVYGGESASTGDHVELEGSLADKASENPDFSKVLTRKTKKVKNGNTSGNKKQSGS